LAIKERILRESLERAHLELPPDQPTLPSPLPFGYRSRLRLHLDPAGRLGFHESASNTVVPIQRCLLAVEPINRVIAALVEGDWPERLAGWIAAVELIYSPADDRVFLVLQPRPGLKDPLVAGLPDQMRSLADVILLTAVPPGRHQNPAAAALSQDFALHGLTYRLTWDHRCFFQVNCRQNPRLIGLALDCLPRQPQPHAALDLFCGMGNFSIPLALRGATVTGVEHNRRSIHWAEANSRAAGLTSARFLAADVEQQIKTLVGRKTRFDCILLDPPRQGLGKAAALLPLLAPERILSISCDPATLARDLALITRADYRLTRLIPVDMFPQTHHIESVALLERN
jgi:23S rRNA (uracil1939-C5)-methyltransferase